MNNMDRELIEEKFKGVYSRLDANNDLIHAELKEITTLVKLTHEQACKTNGRVTKLEQQTSLIRWLTCKPARLVSLIVLITSIIHYSPDLLEKIIKLLS